MNACDAIAVIIPTALLSFGHSCPPAPRRRIGLQLHLKNKFGSGYRLKITRQQADHNGNEAGSFDEIDSFVKSQICSEAKSVTDRHASSIVYSMPKACGVRIRPTVMSLYWRDAPCTSVASVQEGVVGVSGLVLLPVLCACIHQCATPTTRTGQREGVGDIPADGGE